MVIVPRIGEMTEQLYRRFQLCDAGMESKDDLFCMLYVQGMCLLHALIKMKAYEKPRLFGCWNS